MLFFFIQI